MNEHIFDCDRIPSAGETEFLKCSSATYLYTTETCVKDRIGPLCYRFVFFGATVIGLCHDSSTGPVTVKRLVFGL